MNCPLKPCIECQGTLEIMCETPCPNCPLGVTV